MPSRTAPNVKQGKHGCKTARAATHVSVTKTKHYGVGMGHMNGLVGGEEEDYSSNDDAKNPEEGVDAAVEGSGVWIGFGRHGSEN